MTMSDPATRRRWQQMRDLFEMAGELPSDRDEERLMYTLIRKARQLIGTDTAYLMLLDYENGDTYMRVSEGTISPTFDTIRLGMGLGLGGQVAQSMSPRWTRNYLEDEQYTHVIDPIIREEGLKAILGVPVRKHDRLIGMLFTSDRVERDFTETQITLLSLLADHASIALSNASLHANLESELEAERALAAALADENRHLERERAAHARLSDLVVEGASMDTLVGTLVDLTGGSVLVVDEDGRVTSSAPVEGEDPDFEEVRALIGHDPPAELTTVTVPRTSADPSDGAATPAAVAPMRSGEDGTSTPAAVAPVRSGEDAFGHLAVVGVRADDQPGVIMRAAGVIALVLLSRRARDEADNRLRGEILAEILSAAPSDPESLGRRAQLLGVDLGSEMVGVVILPTSGRVTRALRGEVGVLARRVGGLATSYGDRVVMVVPARQESPGDGARRVAATLDHLGVVVGSSGPVHGAGAVRDHLERAGRAARLLQKLGRSGSGSSAEELGMYGLLFSEVDGAYLEAFVRRQLDPVESYDRSRGTELAETLRAYFDADGHVADAADRMFVHVNTVYQRLGRLDRVLGADWRTGDRALELRLAVRLRDLMAD